MKNAAKLLSLSALGLGLCGAARADLAWEHRLSVRLGAGERTKPVASVTLRTQWQAQADDPSTAARQRVVARATAKDFENLPPLPMGVLRPSSQAADDVELDDDELSSFVKQFTRGFSANLLPGGDSLLPTLLPEYSLFSMGGRGLSNAARAQAKPAAARRRPGEPIETAIVTDLAADRFLTYVSSQRTSLGGPLRPTLKRVRFDPWKKLAPRLSEDNPESLTHTQRARLGAEVRAIYRPFLKNSLKLYFRQLEETRTIAGMQARGYRLAALVNIGNPYGGRPEWAQMRAEMWLAPEQEGDAVVRSFNRQVRDIRNALGGSTSSMWANELGPVAWQMMPQELLQLVETVVPPAGRPNEFFGGTPLLVHLTVSPPPVQRMATGDVRMDLTMVSRSTEALPASAFEMPEGYKAEALEPLLQQYDKAMNQLYTEFDKAKPK